MSWDLLNSSEYFLHKIGAVGNVIWEKDEVATVLSCFAPQGGSSDIQRTTLLFLLIYTSSHSLSLKGFHQIQGKIIGG